MQPHYGPAVHPKLFLLAAVTALMLLGGCASAGVADQFGPVLSPVREIVGTQVKANNVVAMPCIPSRNDPVGVWLAMAVSKAEVVGDVFTITLQETDARLGSHPSGCRNPTTLFAQSVFLLDGDEPIFATAQSEAGPLTTLEFSVTDRSLDELDLVILPTIEFEMGDGVRQTTVFGLIGRYSLQ